MCRQPLLPSGPVFWCLKCVKIHQVSIVVKGILKIRYSFDIHFHLLLFCVKSSHLKHVFGGQNVYNSAASKPA